MEIEFFKGNNNDFYDVERVPVFDIYRAINDKELYYLKYERFKMKDIMDYAVTLSKEEAEKEFLVTPCQTISDTIKYSFAEVLKMPFERVYDTEWYVDLEDEDDNM